MVARGLTHGQRSWGHVERKNGTTLKEYIEFFCWIRDADNFGGRERGFEWRCAIIREFTLAPPLFSRGHAHTAYTPRIIYMLMLRLPPMFIPDWLDPWFWPYCKLITPWPSCWKSSARMSATWRVAPMDIPRCGGGYVTRLRKILEAWLNVDNKIVYCILNRICLFEKLLTLIIYYSIL